MAYLTLRSPSPHQPPSLSLPSPAGDTSEEVATRFNVSREEQDRVAAASHAKAAAARAAGKFKKEIVPLEVQWIDPTTSEFGGLQLHRECSPPVSAVVGCSWLR